MLVVLRVKRFPLILQGEFVFYTLHIVAGRIVPAGFFHPVCFFFGTQRLYNGDEEKSPDIARQEKLVKAFVVGDRMPAEGKKRNDVEHQKVKTGTNPGNKEQIRNAPHRFGRVLFRAFEKDKISGAEYGRGYGNDDEFKEHIHRPRRDQF